MINEQDKRIREAETRRKEPQEKCLCYVSFAAGGEWLGGVYVELDYDEHLDPKVRMTELRLNPGGEALCIPVPLGRLPIDRKWRNRLIVDPKELAEAVQGEVASLEDCYERFPGSAVGFEARIKDGRIGRTREERNRPDPGKAN
jgi:hypothetical protein